MSKLRPAAMAAALVVAAVVGGTLISAVAAAPSPGAAAGAPQPIAPAAPAVVVPDAASGFVDGLTARGEPGPYCQAFRVAFAKNLGVTEDKLVAAAKAAAATAVDKAVADGSVSKADGDRIKARIAAADADGCGILSGGRGMMGGRVLGVARDGLTAAASALGMPLADLHDQLRAGTSLKDVAAAKGVPYASVSAAVTAAVKADLDAAVKAGTLTQARADRILERLETRLANGWTRPDRSGRGAAGRGGGGGLGPMGGGLGQ